MNSNLRSKLETIFYCFGTVVISGLLGFGAGALIVDISPAEDFSWAGLAFIPIWFLLEIYFALVVEVFGNYSKSVRMASIAALIIGFYSAWFTLASTMP